MTIQVVKTLTPDNFTQLCSDLQPGDCFFFAFSNTDDTAPDAVSTTLVTYPGGITTAHTNPSSPDDDKWYPWFHYKIGNSVEGKTNPEESIYYCLWPVSGFTAGAYNVTLNLPSAETSTLRWGVLLRNVNLTTFGTTTRYPVDHIGTPILALDTSGNITVNDYPYEVSLTGVTDAYVLFDLGIDLGTGPYYVAQDASYGTLLETIDSGVGQIYVKGVYTVVDSKLTIDEPNYSGYSELLPTGFTVDYIVIFGQAAMAGAVRVTQFLPLVELDPDSDGDGTADPPGSGDSGGNNDGSPETNRTSLHIADNFITGAGVTIANGDRVVISDNNIAAASGAAISLSYTRHAQVRNNFISGAQADGVYANGCDNLIVRTNTIADVALNTGNFIRLRNCGKGTISENRCTANVATVAHAVALDVSSAAIAVVQNDFRGCYTTDIIDDASVGAIIKRNLPGDDTDTEAILQFVNDLLADTSTIDVTYSETTGLITFDVIDGTVDADTVDGSHATDFAPTVHTHDYAAGSHTHGEDDITDLQDYALANHTHDDRYYTQAQVLALLSAQLTETTLLVFQEDHSAICDGARVLFVLVNEYEPETTRVFLNGLLQRPIVAYAELAGYDTIQFQTAPIAGDELLVEYELR